MRLYHETADERFADAGTRALHPMRVPVAAGGALTEVDGLPFFKEYPTRLPGPEWRHLRALGFP